MDDTELTRLCALAMGYKGESLSTHWGGLPMFASEIGPYNPLHDDAQAMALVKRFDLHIGKTLRTPASPYCEWFVSRTDKYEVAGTDLNRAIVTCVAKMQASVPTLKRTDPP